VQLTLTQQRVNTINKAENKKQTAARIEEELKDIIRNDVIAFLTDPEYKIVNGGVLPKDKDLIKEIRGRVHVLHFAKFLSFHVACLLKNPEDAKTFFSSRKNVQYDLIKKGIEMKQYRKSTIDQYRKKFINMFNADFIADILKLTKQFLAVRFRHANLTPVPEDIDNDLRDGEAEMDFDANPQPITALEDANVKSPVAANPSVIPANVATYNVMYEKTGITIGYSC
jgi:hypothetical protein